MRLNLIRFGCGGGSLLLALLLPAAASAWEGSVYLGAGLGLQRANASTAQFVTGSFSCVTPTTSLACQYDIDDSSFAPSVFLGAQFNKHVALEVGYVRLPDTYTVSVTDPNPNVLQPNRISLAQDSEAVFLRGVFTLPLRQVYNQPWLEKVSASAVLGIARWSSEMDFEFNVATQPMRRFSDSGSGMDLTLGARVNYDITERIRFSVAWDRFQDLGDSQTALPSSVGTNTGVSTVKSSVDVFAVNVAYRF